MTTHALDSRVLRLWDRSAGDGSWAASKPDTLFSVFRASLYAGDYEGGDPSPMRRAYQTETWPVSFYFAADDAQAEEPLVPDLAPRAVAGLSELHLAKALDALDAAVAARFSPTAGVPSGEFPDSTTVATSSLDYRTSGLYDDWDRIISLQNNKTYQVGTRDAVYGEPPCFDLDPEGDDEVAEGLAVLTGDNNAVVVFGALHTHAATFGAAFMESGVVVSDVSGSNYLFTSWLTDRDLTGSALRYLAGTEFEEVADQLFAVDVLPPGLCGNGGGGNGGGGPWCVEFDITTAAGMLLIPAERAYSVTSDACIGPDLDVLLPTRAYLFDLDGATRDPCEGQFGTFACVASSFGSGAYELMYGVGCDASCDGNCTSYISVARTPAIADYGTCHTDTSDQPSGSNLGSNSSSRLALSCDAVTGAFLYEGWDSAGCEGPCNEQSIDAVNLCFPSDEASGCVVSNSTAFEVQPCAGGGEGGDDGKGDARAETGQKAKAAAGVVGSTIRRAVFAKSTSSRW
jgi:hypothetical protein